MGREHKVELYGQFWHQQMYVPEFIDDTESLWGTHIDGVLVAGGYDYLLSIKAEVQGVVVAMGDPVVRLKLGGELEKDSFSLINAIHSKSIIMDKVDLGKGNMISAGAVVVSGAELGKNIIVNTASIVEHDCVLGDGVTIGPGGKYGRSCCHRAGSIYRYRSRYFTKD